MVHTVGAMKGWGEIRDLVHSLGVQVVHALLSSRLPFQEGPGRTGIGDTTLFVHGWNAHLGETEDSATQPVS